FFQVKIYNKDDNLVQTRCVVTVPTACIFEPGPTTPTPIYYSECSCVKLNTTDIQGEPARVDFSMSGCQYCYDYGYVYIDDIYVGDDGPDVCSNSAFGYVIIKPLEDNGSIPGSTCSLLEEPDLGACSP